MNIQAKTNVKKVKYVKLNCDDEGSLTVSKNNSNKNSRTNSNKTNQFTSIASA